MSDEIKENNTQNPDQDQLVASQRVVGRREFLKASAGAAVLGASVLSGVGNVSAEDAEKPGKYATPDWKTNKPGKKDTDLYTDVEYRIA